MENNTVNSNNKSETSQSDGKTSSANTNPTNPLGGFDLSKLMQNDGVMELLKHLLSGGGAMAANYFLWIKPIQDKIDSLNKKVEENEKEIKKQDERIEDLEDEQEGLLKQLDRKNNEQEELQGGGSEFFTLRKSKSLSDYSRRKYSN